MLTIANDMVLCYYKCRISFKVCQEFARNMKNFHTFTQTFAKTEAIMLQIEREKEIERNKVKKAIIEKLDRMSKADLEKILKNL